MPTIVLIDLSSIAHPIWHMRQSDPDTNATATGTVAKVLAELRMERAAAELEKRRLLRQIGDDLDLTQLRATLEKIRHFDSAIFYTEAALRFHDVRAELLPPRLSAPPDPPPPLT